MGAPMCWLVGVWLHVGRELLELVTVSPRPAAGAPAPKFWAPWHPVRRDLRVLHCTSRRNSELRKKHPTMKSRFDFFNMFFFFFEIPIRIIMVKGKPPMPHRSAGHCHGRRTTVIIGPDDRIYLVYLIQNRYANEGNEIPSDMWYAIRHSDPNVYYPVCLFYICVPFFTVSDVARTRMKDFV